MFCPKCKCEFRDGFYECADCNTVLVYELPEEESGIQFKELKASSNPAENRVRLSSNVKVHNLNTMFKKTYSYASFVLFLLLLVLFVLLVTGKSDLLTVIMTGYLNWVKEGSITLVLIVYLLASFLCSKFVTVGIFGNLLARKEGWSTRMFWLFSVVFFVAQLTGMFFLRTRT